MDGFTNRGVPWTGESTVWCWFGGRESTISLLLPWRSLRLEQLSEPFLCHSNGRRVSQLYILNPFAISFKCSSRPCLQQRYSSKQICCLIEFARTFYFDLRKLKLWLYLFFVVRETCLFFSNLFLTLTTNFLSDPIGEVFSVNVVRFLRGKSSLLEFH